MSLTCFTAAKGKVSSGIDGAWFPLQAQPCVMPVADLTVDVCDALDKDRVDQLLAAGDPSVFSFGEGRLVPTKQKPTKDACLIAVDLKEFWPLGDLGDESSLVVLEGSGKAVLRASAGNTFLGCDGQVLVFPPGSKPKLVPEDTLSKAVITGAAKARSRLDNFRTLKVPT